MFDNPPLLAGALSGFTVRLLSQPLDVLKIRFQLQVEPISRNSSDSYYNSILHAIRRIYVEEGVSGFWKGHIPAQALSIVYNSIQFSSFERLYSHWKKEHCPTNDFIFGGLSGCAASVFCHPIDVVRTRMVGQGIKKLYSGSANAVVVIMQREGIRGFFRGLAPSMALIFPQTAIQFSVYHESLRLFTIHASYFRESHTHLTSLLSGSVAGMISKAVVYPLELTKRRLQVQDSSKLVGHSVVYMRPPGHTIPSSSP